MGVYSFKEGFNFSPFKNNGQSTSRATGRIGSFSAVRWRFFLYKTSVCYMYLNPTFLIFTFMYLHICSITDESTNLWRQKVHPPFLLEHAWTWRGNLVCWGEGTRCVKQSYRLERLRYELQNSVSYNLMQRQLNFRNTSSAGTNNLRIDHQV